MKAALIAFLSLVPLSGPVTAQGRRGDQDEAFNKRRDGALRPLREIEARVVPGMQRRGAEYIGAELDDGRYRLKFVRAGAVIWVDIDGGTGAVLARAGE